MNKQFFLVMFYFFGMYYCQAQFDEKLLSDFEHKNIRDIQKMQYFPKDKEFDSYYTVYYASIPFDDWSIESIKNSTILSKLDFEKKTIKKNFCKRRQTFSSIVYFVNSSENNNYFFTDGDLFYTKFTDLDTILVSNLIKEKGTVFINITNLNSNIYFIIKNGKIIKIFDRIIKRTYLTENYINSCLDNLKLNNTFEFLNTKF